MSITGGRMMLCRYFNLEERLTEEGVNEQSWKEFLFESNSKDNLWPKKQTAGRCRLSRTCKTFPWRKKINFGRGIGKKRMFYPELPSVKLTLISFVQCFCKRDRGRNGSRLSPYSSIVDLFTDSIKPAHVGRFILISLKINRQRRALRSYSKSQPYCDHLLMNRSTQGD